MINNRQGGRRRGRGGSGGRVPNNAPSGGNRQDNRQRGNAAQLLEKYRQLARDAQLQGDRVQSESYHQYAEHYFRVLNENRPRFEEQQRRSREDEYGDDDEGEEDMIAADGDAGEDQGQSDDYNQRRGNERPRRDFRDQPREAREPREPREIRQPREQRPVEAEGYRNGEPRQDDRPRRRPRDGNGDGSGRDHSGRDNSGRGDDAGEARISLDSLPPAISASITPIDGDGDGQDSPRPRRRTRRPRAEDTGDVAPAAA